MRRFTFSEPGLSKLTTEETFEAIVDAVLVLSRLAMDHPTIVEADINPLTLGPNGAVAVDALIVVEDPERLGASSD